MKRWFRCAKGFILAAPLLLAPLIFMNSAYRFGNETWRFFLCFPFLFIFPFLFYEFGPFKKTDIKLIRILILAFFLFSTEIVFYHLPPNFSQFYFDGGFYSKLIFAAFVLPAAAISGNVFQKNKLIIVQKEI